MSWLVVVAILMGLPVMAEGGLSLGSEISDNLQRHLLNITGVMDMLRNEGPFTVFLPTESALSHFMRVHNISVSTITKDPGTLKNYILNSIVNGKIDFGHMYNERILTTLSGGKIRINNYGSVRMVQGVYMHTRVIVTPNGRLYDLNGLIMPVNESIAEIISSQTDLSTLANATRASGLDTFLNDQNPVTLFAPTNTAFKALGDKLNTLLAKPQLLAEILKYHVVPGTLYTQGLHNFSLPTFEGNDRLNISYPHGYLSVDGAPLLSGQTNTPATNGAIHKIDKVLIPASLRNQI